MSRACLAWQYRLNRLCVLKVVRKGLAFDEGLCERAAGEVRALARVDCAGVVGVFDLRDAPDGRQLLATEYVEGGTLANLLRHGRP